MSLKMYFIELATEHQDLLELMCHNYVHQWVNKEVTAKPKVSSKYMIEEKLEHLKVLKDKLSRKERQFANKEVVDGQEKVSGGKRERGK